MTPSRSPNHDPLRVAVSLDRDAEPCLNHDDRLAVDRLRAALAQRIALTPPPDFADRVLTAALLDRSRRQRLRLRLATWAVAAGVVLACGLAFVMPRTKPQSVVIRQAVRLPSQPQPPTQADDPPSLREALDRASGAVVGLTRRAAEESAVGSTLALLQPGPPVPEVAPEAWPTDLEPAARTLAEVRAGAAASIEPMTRSAARAVDLFLRDWPLDADRRGPS